LESAANISTKVGPNIGDANILVAAPLAGETMQGAFAD
jgi:hypothetical protein